MSHTQTDLVNAVLGELGIVGASEAASDADFQAVKSAVTPTVEKYVSLGVALASDTADMDELPDGIFLPLAQLVAYECLGRFLIGGERLQIAAANRAQAERDLRRIYRQAFDPKRLRMPRIGRRAWPYGGGAYNPATGE